VAYDPAAGCPGFDAFLARIQPDIEVRSFLQRWMGLSLSGLPVQRLVFLYGAGANGKSVLVDLCARIAGGYGATARIESVTAGPARVEVRGGGRLLASRDVELAAGPNHVALELAFPEEGVNALELRVSAPGDAHREDDVLPRLATATARQRVLYVEGRPASARYLRRALIEAGLDVTTGGREVARPGSLDAHDAVILSDVPARWLSRAFQTELQGFVSRGGGLVLIGGESVYGREGYSDSVVEATLPVHFRIREEKRDLALMVVLDKSYSMKGPKMELAKEATKAALDLLEERHRFGVVSFDWDPYVTVALQPATDKPALFEEIGRIRASAQTNIFPALEEAVQQLAASDAKDKHVILLSDGRSYPDDYEKLVDRMREAEITVSTVAVGAEADRELLASIAAWGLGRRYAIEDASRVQQIFIEETRRAVQATLVEEPFRPVLRQPSAVLEGLDLAGAPPLLGYVSTQPRDAAEVLLESANGAPVLARWRFGLGTAVAFTSDAKDRWAADWLEWPGYGRFWGQVVRDALRSQPAPRTLEVTRDGDRAHAVATLRDSAGQPRDGLRLLLAAVRDDGFEQTVPLPQVGLGRYATELPLPGGGSGWRFRVVGGGGEDAPEAALAPRLASERRLAPLDAEALSRIAALTGGRFGPAAETALRERGETARVPTPLLPWLAGAALVVWLLDVAVRRAPWFWRRWAGEAEPLGARPAAVRPPS